MWISIVIRNALAVIYCACLPNTKWLSYKCIQREKKKKTMPGYVVMKINIFIYIVHILHIFSKYIQTHGYHGARYTVTKYSLEFGMEICRRYLARCVLDTSHLYGTLRLTSLRFVPRPMQDLDLHCSSYHAYSMIIPKRSRRPKHADISQQQCDGRCSFIRDKRQFVSETFQRTRL